MGKINFGKYSYGDIKIVGGTRGTVNIGKYCSLGYGIKAFMSHDHNINNISSFPFGHPNMAITKLMKPPLPTRNDYNIRRKLEINIGNDVFIGSEVILFRDITIGDGVAIGAYSIVTKDIPPYSVVVGHSKIISKRFKDEDIEFLMRLKWWNLKDEEVAEIAPILCSSDIDKLREWARKTNKVLWQ